MSSPATKKQRTQPAFQLFYWPGIPGRGEYIRLPLEAAGVAYSDVVRESDKGMSEMQKFMNGKTIGDGAGNPPCFAPPILRVPGAGKDGKDLLMHQTPNILQYLGKRIGMVPDDEADQVHVAQLALTALDMSNEAHDTHHPIAVMDYYENQKEESLKKAKDFRGNRIPKFFSYFERTLKGNQEQGQGKYLVGDQLTYADTTVWQVVDGLYFAFPKEMAARENEFKLLLGTFYPNVKEEKGIKEYLASERREKYSKGLFRKYPELDRE